jgi:site-specific DNA-methyltransferase (adenine-specific)
MVSRTKIVGKHERDCALREDPPAYHANGAASRHGRTAAKSKHKKILLSSRDRDFNRIKATIEPQLIFSASDALVAQGDSLPLLRALPAHSVSLILTDPPYHATKKRNIYGDTAFSEDQHYIEWMAEYATEWRRVLRPNGSLFCFCDSSMAARLEVLFSKNFNLLSHVVWTKPNDPGFDGWKGKMKKEALRQWYPHSERILFAEPAIEGNLFRSPFALFLRDVRKRSGLSMHQLTAKIGAHGKVNHGGAVSNWEDGRNTPSRKQYEKMCKTLIETGKIESMPPYEDVIRPFTMDASKEFTDVWTFPSVRPYKGKHPAEKPAAMLEHAIEATTFPGDVVLDCFGGGGNTALAALKLKRRAVVMEIEHAWAAHIASRIEGFCEMEAILGPRGRDERPMPTTAKFRSPQLALFSAVK